MYFCILKTSHSFTWPLRSPLKDTECLSKTGLSVYFVLNICYCTQCIQNIVSGDIPGGPVVKNLPPNARDADSIPSVGTKIPHALKQLSLYTTTTEVHMLWSPKATTRGFTCHKRRSHMTTQRSHELQLRPDEAR